MANITISTIFKYKRQLPRKSDKNRKREGGYKIMFKYNMLPYSGHKYLRLI